MLRNVIELGYEPANLTVHSPPQKKTVEGGFIV